MPVRIGREKVSRQQQYMLNRAIRGSPADQARMLLQVCSDEEVISGEENLHPGWVDLYLDVHASLREVLREDAVASIESVLGQVLFDENIALVDPTKTRLAFLLGAGASKPMPSDIPTVKELLPDLLDRARRLDRSDLQQLADFCEQSSIDNIEDLLTAAQLSEFCTRNPAVLNLVDFLIYRPEPEPDEAFPRRSRRRSADLSGVAFLQDTLQVLFGLLSSRMLPAQPNAGHEAIAQHVKSMAGSAIVTTNYDCCMDLALDAGNAPFSYLLDFANKPSAEQDQATLTALVKLHGSLNWFYCGTCQQVYLIDIKKTVKQYLRDEATYSVIAVCKDCGGQRRGLLVPPLALKFDVAPPLNPLIERAQDSFSNAEAIVVVGFSFAEADMYLSRMITKSMQVNDNVRIVVFDPDFAVADKLKRQLSLRIPDFEPSRVVRVTGDCSDTLPKFLAGELKSSEPTQGR